MEKEAALEEIRRVLRQDTAMYEARASALARMLKTLRTLEAGDERNAERGVNLLPPSQSRTLVFRRDDSLEFERKKLST